MQLSYGAVGIALAVQDAGGKMPGGTSCKSAGERGVAVTAGRPLVVNPR